MNIPNLYNPNNHTIKSLRLTDSEYTSAISAFVVINTDIICINQSKKTIILTTRKTKPAEGLWPIGGRRLSGESPIDSVTRIFKKETGQDIEKSRFKFLTITEHIWDYRKETPTDFGRHDLHFVFTIELKNDELEKVSNNLDKSEYDTEKGLTAIDFEKLEKLDCREIIKDYWKQIFHTK